MRGIAITIATEHCCVYSLISDTRKHARDQAREKGVLRDSVENF